MSTVMKICTNAQSKKVSESTSAEVVWWFPKSNEQYRVRGELLYVGGGSYPKDDDAFLQQARRELWGNLSDPARESFLGSTVPGEPVSNQQQQQQTTTDDIPAGGRDPETGKPVPVPDTFLLVLLFPKQSDYLNLSHNYRQIDKIVEEAEGKWSFEAVHA
jgi:hypothetical protein